uniref:Uncharacterized protein n=1 Tax=Oryza barthii TaxID=65489 RepID=A0A0D3GMI9_9ORYZ
MAAAAAAYRHEGDGPLADAATPTKRLQEGSPRRGGRTRMGTTARSPQNLALHNRAGLAPGGWRGKMASGQGNKYDEERQERIRGNNEALQKVVAERKELPNSRGSHHGSGSSDESQKNQKVLNVVVKLRKRRKERSERGKANWAKMSELHTTGSKSPMKWSSVFTQCTKPIVWKLRVEPVLDQRRLEATVTMQGQCMLGLSIGAHGAVTRAGPT